MILRIPGLIGGFDVVVYHGVDVIFYNSDDEMAHLGDPPIPHSCAVRHAIR
jgi:hypothetical protein